MCRSPSFGGFLCPFPSPIPLQRRQSMDILLPIPSSQYWPVSLENPPQGTHFGARIIGGTVKAIPTPIKPPVPQLRVQAFVCVWGGTMSPASPPRRG